MNILSVVGEIDRCGRAMTALAEIERLHAPRSWGDPFGDCLQLCDHCCFEDSGYRTDDCAAGHEHTATGPVCATAEVIERAAL